MSTVRHGDAAVLCLNDAKSSFRAISSQLIFSNKRSTDGPVPFDYHSAEVDMRIESFTSYALHVCRFKIFTVVFLGPEYTQILPRNMVKKRRSVLFCSLQILRNGCSYSAGQLASPLVIITVSSSRPTRLAPI